MKKLIIMVVIAATLFVAGGGWLLWRHSHSIETQDRKDATAILQLVTDEEQILELSPKLGELSKSLMNLRLPDPASRNLFAKSITLRDIAGMEDGEGASGKSIEVINSDLNLWRVVLDQIAYFDHAKFALSKGRFVDGNHDLFEGEVIFEGSARVQSGEWMGLTSLQRVRWRRHEDSAWRIVLWETASMQSHTSAQRLFSEVLAEALPNASDRQRLRRSEHYEATLDYYASGMNRLPEPYFTPISANQKPALSVVDIDQDGFDDLYVMVRMGVNQLLRNRGDGTFEECAAAYGLDFPGHSTCGLFADFDNDGDPDLLLGRSLQPSLYLENDGNTFRSREEAGPVLPSLAISLAAADFNADGLLDVYLSTYRPAVLGGASPTGGSAKTKRKWPDEFLTEEEANEYYERHANANPKNTPFPNVLDQVGPPNVLLMNQGDGSFARTKAGDSLRVWRNTLQATWADYDEDGDPDLYIANDWARDYLFRNESGESFTDVTDATGVTAFGFAMGASWGDYDQDGKQDLYVSNMYSKAGRRITARVGGIDAKYGESAEGNYLYRQGDGGSFQLVSGLKPPALTVARAGWSWGGQFADLNNDTYLDLYVLSGYFSAPPPYESKIDL